LAALLKLASEGGKSVVAIGECGLDYDRLSFCQKETQIEAFKLHFELARQTKLPMFLHCRAAASDLIPLLRENRSSMIRGGVVHSFDGTLHEALTFTEELGLYIGLNGCSLRTEESLAVVKELPLDRILLETDAPWCDIRPTHASHQVLLKSQDSVIPKPWLPAYKKEKWIEGHLVKGRNEPCTLPQVLHIVATLKGLPVERVAAQTFANSLCLFFPDEKAMLDD
jgi:TatD DNase family protein